jgi:hypothetical protein
MSERLTEERLAEIRAHVETPPQLSSDLFAIELLAHIAAQQAEITRLQEIEKLYREDQERQYREIEGITPSHEELLAAVNRMDAERKKRRDEAWELFGHMTVPELQEYYKTCPWDEEGAVTIVHDAKALEQSAEIKRLLARVGELEAVVALYANEEHWCGTDNDRPTLDWWWFGPSEGKEFAPYTAAAQALANGEQEESTFELEPVHLPTLERIRRIQGKKGPQP